MPVQGEQRSRAQRTLDKLVGEGTKEGELPMMVKVLRAECSGAYHIIAITPYDAPILAGLPDVTSDIAALLNDQTSDDALADIMGRLREAVKRADFALKVVKFDDDIETQDQNLLGYEELKLLVAALRYRARLRRSSTPSRSAPSRKREKRAMGKALWTKAEDATLKKARTDGFSVRQTITVFDQSHGAGKRTPDAIRKRIAHIMTGEPRRKSVHTAWTPEQDRTLLSSLQEHGSTRDGWQKTLTELNAMFPDVQRTVAACRNRVRSIKAGHSDARDKMTEKLQREVAAQNTGS